MLPGTRISEAMLSAACSGIAEVAIKVLRKNSRFEKKFS